MANITFTKQGNHYVANFTVSGDFNLHVERTEASFLQVEQTTVEDGQFAHVGISSGVNYQKVVDIDFSAVVYPKQIRVTTGTMPSKAVVTMAQ